MNIRLTKTSFYRHFYLKLIVNSSFAINTCRISKDGIFGYYMSHLIMVIVRINYRTRCLTGSNVCFISFDRRGFLKNLFYLCFLWYQKSYSIIIIFFSQRYIMRPGNLYI